MNNRIGNVDDTDDVTSLTRATPKAFLKRGLNAIICEHVQSVLYAREAAPQQYIISVF